MTLKSWKCILVATTTPLQLLHLSQVILNQFELFFTIAEIIRARLLVESYGRGGYRPLDWSA